MIGLKICFECSNFDFLAGFQGHNYYFQSWGPIAGVENAALSNTDKPQYDGLWPRAFVGWQAGNRGEVKNRGSGAG